LDGNLVDSIPLNRYIDLTNRAISSFSPYTKDTIVLYPHNLNPYKKSFFAFIDNNGKILESCYINDFLIDSLQNDFWFDCSISPYPIETIDKLYFVAFPCISNIAEKIGVKEESQQNAFKFNFSQWMNYTYMLEINNFLTDTPITNLILSDYYKTNFIEGDMNSFGPINSRYFFAKKDNLCLINSCLSKIIVFDIQTNQRIKEITISSTHTKVGKEIFYCTSCDFVKDGLYVMECDSYASSINRMFFNNEKTKQYYIILSHKLKNKKEWENYNNGDYRPFSVIIYDENFENPKEYAFAAHTYIARNCFMSQEGLWLQRKPEQLTKENYGTQTFDLLKFN
jgi:hypothetical protein